MRADDIWTCREIADGKASVRTGDGKHGRRTHRRDDGAGDRLSLLILNDAA